MRKIKYSSAIREAQFIAMQKDKNVIQIGNGINSPWYVGQTMNGLYDTFGSERMIDTPIAENGITGMAIGAALVGLKPILTFPRMDFMYYAMDQICNNAASINYSLGGSSPVPLLIRAIINRKGEQAAHHSQSLHGLFLHIPGLKIVMPSNAYDAKGMFLSALNENSTVIYIEDKDLYLEESEVPEGYYTVPLDKANIIEHGKDITIVSSSYMLSQTKEAILKLKDQNISAELIDLRSIKPIDEETILKSIKKTGKLLVVDGGWTTGGVSSEIISIISKKGFNCLKAAPSNIALPDLPAPASNILEKAYYPNVQQIIDKALVMLS